MKWHPTKRDSLLVAAMRGGVRILNMRASNKGETEVQNPTCCTECMCINGDHGAENLAYGIDWVPSAGNDEIVASCSFYNHELRLWRF